MILSLHDQPEWGRIYTHPNEEFDLEAVTDEVVGVWSARVWRSTPTSTP